MQLPILKLQLSHEAREPAHMVANLANLASLPGGRGSPVLRTRGGYPQKGAWQQFPPTLCSCSLVSMETEDGRRGLHSSREAEYFPL